MSDSKITLNPTEQNELAFALSIEGNTTDADSKNPMVRFVIEESSSPNAWMYKVEKDPEDPEMVKVDLPSGVFSEGKHYKGKLEVILGSHYFAPTTVDLEFVEPLKVEASVVVKNKKSEVIKEEAKAEPTEKPLVVKSSAAKVVAKAKPQKTIKESADEKKLIAAVFKKICKEAKIENPHQMMKEGSEETKKQLRTLLSIAAKEVRARR